MDNTKDNFPTARSWRDIPQEVKPRAMSRSGRKRYSLGIAKLVSGILFIGASALGAIALVNAYENHPRQIAEATQSGPLRTLTLNTDGVLTREWVEQTLGIPRNTTLMELDLGLLQEKLLSSGQVRIAMVSKGFPDTLNISLTERSPVARLKVPGRDGVPTIVYVARDGVIFEASCLKSSFVDELPWLVEGIRLVRGQDGRISPIPGMEVVSDLLTKARYEGGQLYSLLRYISLEGYERDGQIEARSERCRGLVFSARDDFFRQLAYLDFMVDQLKPSAESPLERVDLSLGQSVPVTLPKPVNTRGQRGAERLASASQASTGSGASLTRSGNASSPRPRVQGVSDAQSSELQSRGTNEARPMLILPSFQKPQRNSTQREL